MTAAMNLTERDEAFFKDVFELIQTKYPDIKEKFGIWRAHQHFPLEKDEVFHETSDVKSRESTLKIIKKSELPENAFATTWKLSNEGPIVAAYCCDLDSRPTTN